MSDHRNDTEAFQRWFEEALGASFPLVLEQPLKQVAEHVWSTKGALKALGGLPMIPCYPRDERELVLTGHWGHGVNSWAFYWIQQQPAGFVFCRLPLWGAYNDPDDERTLLLGFLSEMRAWQERWLTKLRRYELSFNMGSFELHVPDARGRLFRLRADGRELGQQAWWRVLDDDMATIVEGGEPQGRDWMNWILRATREDELGPSAPSFLRRLIRS